MSRAAGARVWYGFGGERAGKMGARPLLGPHRLRREIRRERQSLWRVVDAVQWSMLSSPRWMIVTVMIVTAGVLGVQKEPQPLEELLPETIPMGS